MKRRILGLIVPVLAGLTIVGTGFSVWYFTDSDGSKAQASVNVNLSGYSEIATITIPNTTNYTLDLDSSADEGIHLNNSTSDASADQISGVTVTLNNNSLAGASIDRDLTVTANISFTGSIGSYVSFALDNDPATSWTGTSGSFTATVETSTATGDTETLDVPDLPLTFSWTDEPESASDWSTLNTAVRSSKLSITYTVAWAA